MICLCLNARELSHNRQLVDFYRPWIDMVEYRLDLLSPEARINFPRWAGALHSETGLPGLLTVRTTADGGEWSSNDELRQGLYKSVLQESPPGTYAWVDVEHDRHWPELTSLAHAQGARMICSAHDFSGVPATKDLLALMHSMGRNGAVPKFAGLCRGSADLLTLIEASQALQNEPSASQGFLLLGMGPYGMASRILAPKLGSLFTFSSASTAHLEALGLPVTGPAAPGHLDPKTLHEVYGYKGINRASKVFGVLGNPVMHSRSPAFHNPLIQKAGLNGVYLPFQVDDLDAFRMVAEAIDGEGFSVTIPHKEAVRTWLTSESPGVKGTGACNTLCRRNGCWHGENTDVQGFVEPLQGALSMKNMHLGGLIILVLGAGGAARAVLFALLEGGARVILANRTTARAADLAAELTLSMDLAPGRIYGCGLDGSDVHEALGSLGAGGFDVVVNTTSLGMAHSGTEDQDPAAFINWKGHELAYDIIYTPERTKFLKRAEAAGCTIINGSSMFEVQARCQSQLWGISQG